MNELQDFVSKHLRTFQNKGQLSSNLRNNELRSEFDKCELLLA
jgi:hypothetical protein